MQQHMLRRRQQTLPLVHLVPEVHFFASAHNDPRLDLNGVARVNLVDVANMGLGGEIAAARGDILGITADDLHQPVGGLRKGIQIAALGHMSVVIGPVERHHAALGEDRLADIRNLIETACKTRLGHARRIMGVLKRPCAPVICAQRPHHPNKVVVANTLQLANGMLPGLRIGLPRNQINQRVIIVRHIHQLGPRPAEARPKLREEVLHPRFSTGDTIGFKQTHLRPADAKAIADRIVEFLGGGDAILHKPQRLAPDRLQQAIRHMGIDLFFEMQGIHANRADDLLGLGDHLGRVHIGGDHLHQRHQVDRVERMRDHDLRGVCEPVLQLRGFIARGR